MPPRDSGRKAWYPSGQTIMRVTVRLFAAHREIAGSGSVALDVPDGARVDEAYARICAEHAGLAGRGRGVAFAINREHAAPNAVLHDGDELAILPPVAGG
jgi:molybdopterin converting factor subunit 1